MAFLCPAALSGRRKRRRAGLNRIQSNDSTEKNIRESTESEFEPTKMVVVRDFSPCVDDELEVKRGQHVKALYQENEWRFVVSDDGEEGFIPYTYCIPITDQSRKPIWKHGDENIASQHSVSRPPEAVGKIPNSSSGRDNDVYGHCAVRQPSDKNELLQDFVKMHFGQYIVLFDYDANQEDDINMCRGETVTVLNKDDPDWYWVTTEDGTREGFIPREFLKYVQEANESTNGRNKIYTDSRLSLPTYLNDDHTMKSEVKQLIAICNYNSQGNRELTIEKGEQLFTDNGEIDKLDWLWVYSPQSRKRGFVPSKYVRWSQNTTFL